MVEQVKRFDGERIYLRPLTDTDATKQYADWLNDPEVNVFLETRSASPESLRKYINAQNTNPNSHFFGVFDKTNGIHIGNVKLEPIDWGKKFAVFGILIGNKSYWGKGYGTEATALIVKYGFEHLGLDTIELGVIGQNKRAARVYEKVGFRVIDYKEKDIDHDGVKYDRITMNIKRNE